MEKWNRIHMLRDDVLKALESARNAKVIGKSLEAKVVLYVPDDFAAHIDLDETDLATICIVSQVEIRTDGKGSFQGTVPFSVSVCLSLSCMCVFVWKYTYIFLHVELGSKPQLAFLRCQQLFLRQGL